MVPKNVVYRNGHFYEKSTGKRFSIKTGSEIVVVADSAVFGDCTPAGNFDLESRSEQKIIAELTADYAEVKFQKLLPKGSKLYFYVSSLSEYPHKLRFEVELLEDLFAWLKASWKQQEGRLADCFCKTTKELDNQIDFFEEVYGKSLNEVYKNTFVHFLGNHGNPACNALDRFYVNVYDESKIVRELVSDKKWQSNLSNNQLFAS
ncbi:hypothetical protein GCM10027592_46920 [Spirosoma flavus]